ncbi:MAG TPA: hypothetical protein VF502_00850 [Stellaceae bacterium]
MTESIAMRAALPLLAGVALLAACAPESRPLSQTAPSVSYRINGNDVGQANANAMRYCQQYGSSAQLQGIQQSSSGNVAVFTCAGGAASGTTAGTAVAPAPAYAAPGYGQPGYAAPGAGTTMAPPVQCADVLHQDRPGGSDYHGPPVPECPPSR